MLCLYLSFLSNLEGPYSKYLDWAMNLGLVFRHTYNDFFFFFFFGGVLEIESNALYTLRSPPLSYVSTDILKVIPELWSSGLVEGIFISVLHCIGVGPVMWFVLWQRYILKFLTCTVYSVVSSLIMVGVFFYAWETWSIWWTQK